MHSDSISVARIQTIFLFLVICATQAHQTNTILGYGVHSDLTSPNETIPVTQNVTSMETIWFVVWINQG